MTANLFLTPMDQLQQVVRGTKEQIAKKFGLPVISPDTYHLYENKTKQLWGKEYHIYTFEDGDKDEIILTFKLHKESLEY